MVEQEHADLWDYAKALRDQVEALDDRLTELADGVWDRMDRLSRRLDHEENQRLADWREIDRRLTQVENDR